MGQIHVVFNKLRKIKIVYTSFSESICLSVINRVIEHFQTQVPLGNKLIHMKNNINLQSVIL